MSFWRIFRHYLQMRLPFWRNFRHWLHRKLSKWQLLTQPVPKISSNDDISVSVFNTQTLKQSRSRYRRPNQHSKYPALSSTGYFQSIRFIKIRQLVCFWQDFPSLYKRVLQTAVSTIEIASFWWYDLYTPSCAVYPHERPTLNYDDVIMSKVASQIISLKIVCSTVYSGADQRKHQSSASLTCVSGIHRWPVNPRTKGQ